jgi:hypothetical protein
MRNGPDGSWHEGGGSRARGPRGGKLPRTRQVRAAGTPSWRAMARGAGPVIGRFIPGADTGASSGQGR